MCDPVTAVVVAASVVSTGATIYNQVQSANRQERAIRNQQEVVAQETRDQATGELFDQMRAARREQARIRTAAGEAGLSLSSGSIEGLLNDSEMQGELANDRTVANMESRQRANTAEARSMLSQISKPTALGAGLQLGTAAAGAWAGTPHAAKIAKKG